MRATHFASATFAIPLLLGGCMLPIRPADMSYRTPTTEESKALQTPVTCVGRDECDRAWRKATAWIIERSGWKVQVATDSLLQTFGPGREAVTMAFTLTRKPLAEGWEELVLSPSCNEYGSPCWPYPTPERARAQFAMFMRK